MAVKSTHPLFQGKEVNHIQSWDQWLNLWNNMPILEVRHSLLHVGLKVPVGQRHWDSAKRDYVPAENFDDRVLFYLRVADGWYEEESFTRERPPFGNGNPQYQTGLGTLKGNGIMSRRLAGKAFAVLFSGLFVLPEMEQPYWREERRPYWQCLEGKIVITLLRFFRIESTGRYSMRIRIRNLPHRRWNGEFSLSSESSDVKQHLCERVCQSLTEFLVFLWEKYEPQLMGKPYYGEPLTQEHKKQEEQRLARNEREQKFADSLAKHHYLLARMLIQLGEWKLLMDLTKDESMDERTLGLLQRFAMRGTVEVHIYTGDYCSLQIRNRAPLSLEEVYAHGNWPHCDVAKFLLLYAAREKGRKQKEAGEEAQRKLLREARERQEVEDRERMAKELENKAAKLRKGKDV